MGAPIHGGPFVEVVLRSVHSGGAAAIASNLSFGSGAFGSKLQWLTWSRQLPFGPGICPYPASYARRLLKEAALMPRFAVAFRPAGIRFLTIRSRRIGVGPPLRLAYRDEPGPRRGFHVPHGRDPTGEGALCTPGPRCSHDRPTVPGRNYSGPGPKGSKTPGGQRTSPLTNRPTG